MKNFIKKLCLHNGKVSDKYESQHGQQNIFQLVVHCSVHILICDLFQIIFCYETLKHTLSSVDHIFKYPAK
jgi:hypothetical protein